MTRLRGIAASARQALPLIAASARYRGVATQASSKRGALLATAAYVFLSLVLTWPLARGLARDVAWDLGDPLLTTWILAWDGEQLRAILGGDLARVARFFDANIFYPGSLTLAYSEHLFAQALQVFPIYAATGNPILAYNLVFLSTFVLSGLGAFLLVRELTGNTRAAFVAGLLFAFAPYRWAHASHVQVLSAQWMPFALYGLRRYFETRRRRPLAGAAAALTLQNLSCGYFLLYFPPVVAIYVLWEIGTRGLWRDRRAWGDLLGAAAVVGAVTLPFLLPYKEVRDSLHFTRDLQEIVRYSADVYSYFTASTFNPAWGSVLQAYPKPEGDLFPGAVPLLLAGIALVLWFVQVVRAPVTASASRARRPVLLAIAAVGALYSMLIVAAVFTRRVDVAVAGIDVRATNVTNLFVPLLLSTAALLWLSPTLRARVRAAFRFPEAVFLLVLIVAWWLSLGPSPRVLGRPLELWSPYGVLYDYVPGFEGVRVPARFATLVTLALSVLGGLAVARLRRPRLASVCAAVLAIAFLLETRVYPFPVNMISPVRGYQTPEARVYRPARAPDVYRELARTPPDAIVLEMPLGEPDLDVRSVYYSTAHWRRLVNGYSGFFPPHYYRLVALLSAAPRGDDTAWEAIVALGVTHVVVHEGAYLDDEGVRFSAWLRSHGAVELFRSAGDVLLALPANPAQR